MLKKDKDYLSVAVTEETVKILHWKAGVTEQKIANVVKRDCRGVAVEDLPKVIQSALTELGIKAAPAIYTVPSHLVTTKNIEIPSLDSTEIKSIIDLQAGRHTPYAREEILIGYISIGIFQRNYTKVLLVIVNREVIRKQLAALESGGIRIEKVLFAPEAMAKYYAQMLNVKEEESPIGIINIAQYTTDFIVEYNKTIATCRNIPLGMTNLIKEGQVAREKLIAELRKSIEAYQNEDIHRIPENFYLTSDDAKLKELQPVLQEQLKANVKILPYLERIQGTQNAMLRFVSEYNDDSFLDVVSSVIAESQTQIDLTPDEIKLQRSMEEKGRQVIRTILFTFVILILVFSIFSCRIYFKNLFLGKLSDDYLDKQRSVVELDRIGHKTRIIKDYIHTRLVSLDVINELYRLVPDDIYLESMTLEEDGTIGIQGVSNSMSVIFNFVTALEESPLFKGVKTKSTTAKKEQNKDVAAFEIDFRLESAKDAPKESKVHSKEEKDKDEKGKEEKAAPEGKKK